MSVREATTRGLFLLDVDGRLVYLDVVRERAQAVPDGIDSASVLGRQGWRDPDERERDLGPELERLARELLSA